MIAAICFPAEEFKIMAWNRVCGISMLSILIPGKIVEEKATESKKNLGCVTVIFSLSSGAAASSAEL